MAATRSPVSPGMWREREFRTTGHRIRGDRTTPRGTAIVGRIRSPLVAVLASMFLCHTEETSSAAARRWPRCESLRTSGRVGILPVETRFSGHWKLRLDEIGRVHV